MSEPRQSAEIDRLDSLCKHLAERVEDLEGSLQGAIAWIERDCDPEAEWAAEGHNVSMSGADRLRGIELLASVRRVLARTDDDKDGGGE